MTQARLRIMATKPKLRTNYRGIQMSTPVEKRVEMSFDDIDDSIENLSKDIAQDKFGNITENAMQQDQLGTLFKAGARVYDVEGAKWQEGLTSYEGKGFLGYFGAALESWGHFRVVFYKQYFYPRTNRPLPRHRRVVHPLSRAGYFVPKNGGIHVLDNGATILLSPSGILSGKGGWELVKVWKKKCIQAEMTLQGAEDKMHELTTRLNHTETQFLRLSASKNDVEIWAQGCAKAMHNARDTLTKMNQTAHSLTAQLENSQGINVRQQGIIQKDLTQMSAMCNELLTFVMNDRMFESLAMAGIEVPDMKKEFRQKFKESMTKQGIIPEDKAAKEMQEMRKVIEQQQAALKQLQVIAEQQKSSEQPPKPSPPTPDKGTDEPEPTPETQPPKETDEPPKGVVDKTKAIAQDVINVFKKATQSKPKPADEPPKPDGKAKDESKEESDDDEIGDGGIEELNEDDEDEDI